MGQYHSNNESNATNVLTTIVLIIIIVGTVVFGLDLLGDKVTVEAETAEVTHTETQDVAEAPTEVVVEVAQEPTTEPTVAPTEALTLEPTVVPVVEVTPAEADTALDPEAVARGEISFVLCSACHGMDARGVAGLGKDLVASEFVSGLTDEELLAFIKVGRPVWDPANTTGVDMPPRGGNPALMDEQIMDIIAYIRSL